ncbi:MAG: ATP-binding cassette domain-containing protein, partial [Myxococcota bacterium]
MIEAISLSKRFGAVQALRDVSISAPDGRITGILGPNGAGKSTTLRILSTVMKQDTGEAYVDGISVSDSVSVRPRIGVLPHDSGIYPNLTARENVEYYGQLHGLKGRELSARIDELI